MKYQGSCHCGKITFEVEGEIESALTCNCSLCQRRGSLLWFVPRDKLTLLTSADDIATYTFNKHLILHHFCNICGIHPFGEADDPNGSSVAAINIRCLENIDLAKIPVQQFDGRSV